MEIQQTLSMVDDPQSALLQRSKCSNTVESAMHQSLQWTITPKCGGSFTRLFQLQQTSLMGERLAQKCCEKIGPNPHPGCPSTRPGTGFGPRHLEHATNPRAPQFLGRSFFATIISVGELVGKFEPNRCCHQIIKSSQI